MRSRKVCSYHFLLERLTRRAAIFHAQRGLALHCARSCLPTYKRPSSGGHLSGEFVGLLGAPTSLCSTIRQWYEFSLKSLELISHIVHWVHSYDVTDLMIKSLTSPEATGRRIICTGGKTSWATVCEILKREFPERDITPVKEDETMPQFPGAEDIEFDLSLAQSIKGSKWRSLEDAVISAAKDLLARSDNGWDKDEP